MIRLSKCSFFQIEVKYLGHIVDAFGFRPTDVYRSKVLKLKRPTDKDSVHRYIGFIQWISKFIPNLAQMTAPINRLRGKDVKFVWSPRCESSFRRLQVAVRNAQMLYHPDFHCRFFIQCDVMPPMMRSVRCSFNTMMITMFARMSLCLANWLPTNSIGIHRRRNVLLYIRRLRNGPNSSLAVNSQFLQIIRTWR